MNRRLAVSASVMGLLCGLAAVPASAAQITGSLNIGGSVAVGIQRLDWRPPTDGGNGIFVTVTPGTGYFSAIVNPNPLTPYGGLSKDLTVGPTGGGYTHVDIGGFATPVASYMSAFTAPGYGGLFFDLESVEAPTAPPCTGGEGPNTVCSVTAFTITTSLDNRSSTIVMNITGFFEDSTIVGSRNHYSGLYTTQVNLTTQQIEDILTIPGQHDPTCVPGDNNKICASYSANFVPNAVPEPTTMLTFGAGALMALRRRRAAKK